MNDPWSERNRTAKGRAQAQIEQDIKKSLRDPRNKSGNKGMPYQNMRDPNAPIKREEGYPRPKPIWEPE
jgi:hypothetical protein